MESMKVNEEQGLKQSKVEVEGAEGAFLRILVGPDDGSDGIVMRLFTLEPGGHTPLHEHRWEHLVKVEKGRGVIVDGEGREKPLARGNSVFVAPGEVHQFRNAGGEEFEFVCVIPNPEKQSGC